MVATPADKQHATPREWLEGYRVALELLPRPNPQADAIDKCIVEVLAKNTSVDETISWQAALDSTSWPDYGDQDFPDHLAFHSARPALITPQGQNRACMAIIALGPGLKL
ncbi:unnamed protein product, partial [Pylaiella littoralis]